MSVFARQRHQIDSFHEVMFIGLNQWFSTRSPQPHRGSQYNRGAP